MRKNRFIVMILFLPAIFGFVFTFSSISEMILMKKAETSYIAATAYYKDFDTYEQPRLSRYGPELRYYLVYEYKVNGEAYTFKKKTASRDFPEKDATIIIYYNPENPQRAVSAKPQTSSDNIAFDALLFAVPSVLLIFFVRKNKISLRSIMQGY